jgi:energy-coupling factor transporter ATP-binding protein EcfA2
LRQKFYIEDIPEKRYNEFVAKCASINLGLNLIPDLHFKEDLYQYGYGQVRNSARTIHFEIKSKDISRVDFFNKSISRTTQIFSERMDVRRTIVFAPFYLSVEEKNRFAISVKNYNRNLIVEIWDNSDIDKIVDENPNIFFQFLVFKNYWFECYEVIADKINKIYKSIPNNEKKKPGIYFYNLLKDSEYAKNIEDRFFNRKNEETRFSIDPVQIFASFNYSGINISKRVLIIQMLLKELGSLITIDEHSVFDGIPSPITTSIGRFRDDVDQNEIWDAFSKLVDLRDDVPDYFRTIRNWKGIDIPSFTIFLFWINSSKYVPLDKNTIIYLQDIDLANSRPNKFSEYLKLCHKISEKSDSIRIIVEEAYNYSRKEVEGNIISGATHSIIAKVAKDKLIEKEDKNDIEEKLQAKQKQRAKGFQIIAIKPTKIQKHLKNLKVDQVYSFYNSYSFEDENAGIIKYNPDHELNIYNQKNDDSKKELNISISAIVGSNGSGKSSLIEMIYLIVNKISVAKRIDTTIDLIDEEVYAELYYRSDRLYKLSVGDKIELFEYLYSEDTSTYTIVNSTMHRDEELFDTFNLSNFCYSLGINYSLYGLNRIHLEDWIDSLFHKNDSYQVPVVLNPKRKNGNIDVNNEEYLAKSRLLSNILDFDIILKNKREVPEIVPNTTPISISLELDEDKLNRKKKNYSDKYDALPTLDQINLVLDSLGCDNTVNKEFSEEAKLYIFLKVVDICDWYPNFKKDYADLPNKIDSSREPKKLLSKLSKSLIDDTSHITFKLKQALNYLKYDLFQVGSENGILELAEKINRSLSGDEKVIEFVPPPFFRSNLIFDHGGTFNDLSSGEKQQILSINTVGYHIYNLESVLEYEDNYKYSAVNVMFDEVELYFHPDMQRKFIYNLLQRISTLRLSYINNIAIMFVTHSPFILSDIPSQNVLRLENREKKSVPVPINDQTFGANVHSLLANDFFLKQGFMGEFAKRKINEAVDTMKIIQILELAEKNGRIFRKNSAKLKYLKKNSVGFKDLNDLKLLSPEECEQIINCVGEPMLHLSLMELYAETFKSKKKMFIEQQIEKLRKLQ